MLCIPSRWNQLSISSCKGNEQNPSFLSVLQFSANKHSNCYPGLLSRCHVKNYGGSQVCFLDIWRWGVLGRKSGRAWKDQTHSDDCVVLAYSFFASCYNCCLGSAYCSTPQKLVEITVQLVLGKLFSELVDHNWQIQGGKSRLTALFQFQ